MTVDESLRVAKLFDKAFIVPYILKVESIESYPEIESKFKDAGLLYACNGQNHLYKDYRQYLKLCGP